MRFLPQRCPRSDCPSLASGHHRFQRKGRYLRACDGRSVPRFLCLECHRTFSSQSFRLDYRLKRPDLHLALFSAFVSKVTHRQAARVLGCPRKLVEHRLRLLGGHCRDFHFRRLDLATRSRRLVGRFQLDELETFEHSRRLQPVTVPVLIERKSYFVLDLRAAPLPCRGGLSARDKEKKLERERLLGKRKSGSNRAVRECLETLERVHAERGPVLIDTDQKAAYAKTLKERWGGRLRHERHSGKKRRDYGNPLFPINHTLAMMRDGISRLVRRSWGASKLKERLETHAWIWAVWRNYVRGITNRAPETSPAMALGIERDRWTIAELCAWRVLDTN